jgi:hypothetical protein
MRESLSKIRNIVFYVLVVLFAVIVASLGGRLLDVPFAVTAVLAIVFGLLGIVLVVLAARLEGPRIQKVFFILTGASAAGMPVFAVLHNLVYALLIALFGEGFWEGRTGGGDEPVFFILAVLVCPALFLIGTVGSIALFVKARTARRAEVPQSDDAAN